MDKSRRKELIEQYKQIKVYMGVIQVKNTVNGKLFIDVSPNLKNRWLNIKAQLTEGKHPNGGLQADWNQLGEDVFVYEVLEQAECDNTTDKKWELSQMIKPWMEKLEPYGERGYNRKKE